MTEFGIIIALIEDVELRNAMKLKLNIDVENEATNLTQNIITRSEVEGVDSSL